jgi:hypothetical protein
VKNSTYKENLMKLKNFVMVKFLQDTMVIPKESEVRKDFGDTASLELPT